MSYEDKEVRDFCYALMNKRNRIQAIFVAPWVITGWQLSTALGPTVICISDDFLDKLKRGLGVADQIKLVKLKGWDINYLTTAPTTMI